MFPFKVRLAPALSVWLPFKTNLIRQEFGLLGSWTERQPQRETKWKSCEEHRCVASAAVCISVLMGKMNSVVAGDGVPFNLPETGHETLVRLPPCGFLCGLNSPVNLHT